ncbi:helix-turn-helix domain-containing protein [Streptomyces sp. NPDC018031]|uniref:helix-turn-helix transcriptional regulator n=1 Tax=Streptomyces sp. NPDC018031 TaxID=3365033 RepID=UPI0037BAEB6C
MYRERAARPAGAVVWTRTAAGGAERVLPDGCTDLIWRERGGAGELIIAGPDTAAQVSESPAGVRYTGLRFAPGTGPAVFGIPACELRDLRVPLDAVWPAADVRRLTGLLTGSDRPGRVLEAAALARLRDAPPADPAIAAVVAELTGGSPVGAVADRVGLSVRQLHRRSLAAFGYGPKTLARVLRLNRALDAAREGRPFADVAADHGYADQAHLAREVRALTGVPLGELTGARRASPGGGPGGAPGPDAG